MSAPSLVSAFSPAPQLPAPRAFGTTAEDLDLDFDQTERTALATSVLARCCDGLEQSLSLRENLAWSLPLSMRIARLLRIVALTTGSGQLAATPTCTHSDCRQPYEIALPVDALVGEWDKTASADHIVRFPLENSAALILRLPTGRDQAEWRRRHYADATAALNGIVQSLVVGPAESPRLSAEQLAPLAAIMEEADPLVAFTVHTTCPHCGRSGDIAVDLEAVALQELARFRRGVLADVHLFAAQYGWSESEVLAIPPRRRADYRKLIAAGERALP